MIKYVKGNLLEATEPYIGHGCNAQGVMGSGVALAIKTKWPKAFDDYRREFDETGLELGSIINSPQPDGKIILNCITQNYYGRNALRYASYDAIDDCMVGLRNFGYDNIAFPKIGAGLGGGSWEVIEAIINHRLIDRNVTIYCL